MRFDDSDSSFRKFTDSGFIKLSDSESNSDFGLWKFSDSDFEKSPVSDYLSNLIQSFLKSVEFNFEFSEFADSDFKKPRIRCPDFIFRYFTWKS